MTGSTTVEPVSADTAGADHNRVREVLGDRRSMTPPALPDQDHPKRTDWCARASQSAYRTEH